VFNRREQSNRGHLHRVQPSDHDQLLQGASSTRTGRWPAIRWMKFSGVFSNCLRRGPAACRCASTRRHSDSFRSLPGSSTAPARASAFRTGRVSEALRHHSSARRPISNTPTWVGRRLLFWRAKRALPHYGHSGGARASETNTYWPRAGCNFVCDKWRDSASFDVSQGLRRRTDAGALRQAQSVT
jgi:hypothetical protein